jgi:glycosyltransferase involved in cell wall biosynthesis
MNVNNATTKNAPKEITTILLIIDSYGWAFDNISKNVKKYVNDYLSNYEIKIITYPKLYDCIKTNTIENEIDDVNHVLFFWYAGQNLEILDYFNEHKEKHNVKTINLCIYDYSKWINNDANNKVYFDGITYFFNKIDNYLYGCNFIKLYVDKTFGDIIKKRKIGSYPVFDGVDVDMFPNFGYTSNLIDKKKLIIGWIGNSNPQVHGINKGFSIIKKCIDDMSDKFVFMPLDIYTSGVIIRHENVHCYMSLIDIIVCYSMYEGTPNQILEASSCGKCWISTNVGIVEELQNTLTNKPCGIIINRNEKDLLFALLYFYQNREKMIEYGKNGREAIEKKWDWKKNANQFYNFFSHTNNYNIVTNIYKPIKNMKILIITDERTGGVSFSRICGAIVGGLCVDDINTHFDKIKNKDVTSWAYNFCVVNNIKLHEYFDDYKSFDDVNIYNMIIFLFENGVDVFKLSINDNFWTTKQTQDLIGALNTNDDKLTLIKLIRQNNFNKILSKCTAITLHKIIGDQAYDVKTDKYEIYIDENDFKHICGVKLNTHKIINSVLVPQENVFVYETFYNDIKNVERLKKILKCNTIKNNDLFLENYYKDYKSENVTVKNIDNLKKIFVDSYFH